MTRLFGRRSKASGRFPARSTRGRGNEIEALDAIQDLASAGQAAVKRSTFSPGQALARGNVALALIAVLMGAFAVLFALVRSQRSAATDLAITMKLQRRREPWIERVMRVVSWPGFPPQSRIIPPALAGTLWALGLRLEAVFQLAAWGASAISFLVKQLMRRPRPNHSDIRVALARISDTSFPSGHVLAYVSVYGFLTYLINTLLRPAWFRRALSAMLMTFIALVGLSRVYLGHHWFTDVLASYLLGLAYLIGLTSLYRKVKEWAQA